MAAGDISLAVVGNLTADVELRDAGQSKVANFTVVSNPRVYNKQTMQWEDGEPIFTRCVAWRQLAENLAKSAGKGTRLVVTGALKGRTYEDPQGQKKYAQELEAFDIGLSLTFAAGRLTQANTGGGNYQQPAGAANGQAYGSPPGSYGGGQQYGGQQQGGGYGAGGGYGQRPAGGQQQRPNQQQEDPWAAPGGNGNWGNGNNAEPPF